MVVVVVVVVGVVGGSGGGSGSGDSGGGVNRYDKIDEDVPGLLPPPPHPQQSWRRAHRHPLGCHNNCLTLIFKHELFHFLLLCVSRGAGAEGAGRGDGGGISKERKEGRKTTTKTKKVMRTKRERDGFEVQKEEAKTEKHE
ncbi:hypothetical protein E2C01_051926 [Portunus trituberculatus]|uniref:Uncharacterized protein n=1 Tax=Portunus trituberculatus TaxID=210409 RepID=A0A5B7GN14_PORTR|nr:hypothetical protein [Portunus trituberculatus]